MIESPFSERMQCLWFQAAKALYRRLDQDNQKRPSFSSGEETDESVEYLLRGIHAS